MVTDDWRQQSSYPYPSFYPDTGMEREQLRVEADNTEWMSTDATPAQPVLHLRYEGSRDRFDADLAPRIRSDLAPDNLEVTVRVVGAAADRDEGVLSIGDAVTGAYLFECDVAPSVIRSVVQAGQAYSDRTGDPPQYYLRLEVTPETIADIQLGLLLVYDAEGRLLRSGSLIPGEIEL